MKHEKISIKWKVFLYLLSFSTILLCLLWFFQTVYLDDFYEKIKKHEIRNAVDNVVSILDEENISDALDTIAARYEICIVVADREGNKLYSAERAMNCSLHQFTVEKRAKLFRQALENGGETEIRTQRGQERTVTGKPPEKDFDKDDKEQPQKDGNEEQNNWQGRMTSGGEGQNNRDKQKEKYEKLTNMPDDHLESIIHVKLVRTASGETYAVMVDAVITPVDATVHTLRIQLICISILMVLLSLVIAFVIAKRFSRSIIGINNTAKEFAKGNFEVDFNGKDYREVAELSETLNYAAKELAKTDHLQKELLANVSHDLRTPLTMITAYAEVMRDLPGENTPENVQIIIDEANRLTILVNDLLDMSKIQSGVTKLETKVYDLTESIKAIIQRHSKLLKPYGYQIRFNYDQHVLVEADEFKMYQVIYNLIANAVNYSGENREVIVIQKKAGQKIRIEVTDHGEGIPKEQLESVWQRYYKIDKNHKRAIVGSGLGLSIVRNILEMHKADYGVISEEGKGSTFWFELPIETLE